MVYAEAGERMVAALCRAKLQGVVPVVTVLEAEAYKQPGFRLGSGANEYWINSPYYKGPLKVIPNGDAAQEPAWMMRLT